MVVLVITYSGVSSALRMPAMVCFQAPCASTMWSWMVGIVRFEGDLHVIQPRFHQLCDEFAGRQPATVGVQAGDLPVALGVGDQLGQIVPQGGLAAGEDHVRDAQLPQLVQDALPLIRR